jgi:hypothetical protein
LGLGKQGRKFPEGLVEYQSQFPLFRWLVDPKYRERGGQEIGRGN